jgi:hypothetical protein
VVPTVIEATPPADIYVDAIGCLAKPLPAKPHLDRSIPHVSAGVLRDQHDLLISGLAGPAPWSTHTWVPSEEIASGLSNP